MGIVSWGLTLALSLSVLGAFGHADERDFAERGGELYAKSVQASFRGYQEVLAYAAQLRDSGMSDEDFFVAMDQGKIKIDLANALELGDSIYSINGKMTRVKFKNEQGELEALSVVRVALVFERKTVIRDDLHPMQSIAFVFVPEEQARTYWSSRHFKQMIASQQVDGGRKALERSDKVTANALRAIGVRPGRDVFIMTSSQENSDENSQSVPVELEARPKPKWYSRAGLVASWRATVAPITKDDLVMGTACVLAQTLVSGCFSALQAHLEHHAFSYGALGLTAGYAAFFGVLAPTTRRYFSMRGGNFETSVKNGLSSLSYSIWLKAITKHGFFNLMMADYFRVGMNFAISQMGKKERRELMQMRFDLRLDVRPVEFKLPLLGDIKLKRADVFGQTFYMLPFTLKFLDLTGIGIKNPFPFDVPIIMDSGKLLIGSLLLYSSPLLMQPILAYYAKIWGHPWADQYAQRVDRLKKLIFFPYYGPKAIVDRIKAQKECQQNYDSEPPY